MSDIYKKAAYILAVPDLHFGYLKKNPLNNNILDADEKYKQAVYNDIFNNNSYSRSTDKNQIATIKRENENRPKKKKVHRLLKQIMHSDYQSITDDKIMRIENEDKKKIYQFLAYLIEDWSNRAWVISEYLIAKEKQKTQGVPLKYIFISLLHQELTFFFSCSFDHQHRSSFTTINTDKNNKIKPWEVDDGSKFNNFLKTVFTQRSYLSMLLVSKAARNEDKFNAILPIWDRYHHWIKGINTISEWNITDSISVQLKLYEMMDDLWDKARLLHACSKNFSLSLLPSYVRRYQDFDLFIIEKDKVDMACEKYMSCIKEYALDTFGNNNSLQHILDNNNNNNKEYASSLYIENLMDIQLNFHDHRHYHQYHYLTIKVKQYFTCKEKPKYNYAILSACSLNYDDDLISVYIPFFTFTIPDFTNVIPPIDSSGIFLFGSMDQNKWVVCSQGKYLDYKNKSSCCIISSIFNVY
ncbi:hypothetical protein BJ944DRAFT_268727 [Cunninghamella echinulata]|nr:hypothetical protein BJ944DRAFT_268727 [Cunninghamella echinulata]